MTMKSTFVVLFTVVLVSVSLGQTSSSGVQIHAKGNRVDVVIPELRESTHDIEVLSDGSSIEIQNSSDIPQTVLGVSLLWHEKGETWSQNKTKYDIPAGGAVRISYTEFVTNYDEKEDSGIPSTVMVGLEDAEVGLRMLTFTQNDEGRLAYSWTLEGGSSTDEKDILLDPPTRE